MKKRSIIQLARNVSAETSMANSSVMQISQLSIENRIHLSVYLKTFFTRSYQSIM